MTSCTWWYVTWPVTCCPWSVTCSVTWPVTWPATWPATWPVTWPVTLYYKIRNMFDFHSPSTICCNVLYYMHWRGRNAWYMWQWLWLVFLHFRCACFWSLLRRLWVSATNFDPWRPEVCLYIYITWSPWQCWSHIPIPSHTVTHWSPCPHLSHTPTLTQSPFTQYFKSQFYSKCKLAYFLIWY